MINELIREYLEFNNYKHTLSVFLPGLKALLCPESTISLLLLTVHVVHRDWAAYRETIPKIFPGPRAAG